MKFTKGDLAVAMLMVGLFISVSAALWATRGARGSLEAVIIVGIAIGIPLLIRARMRARDLGRKDS